MRHCYSSLQLTYTFKTSTKHKKTAKARTLCVHSICRHLIPHSSVSSGPALPWIPLPLLYSFFFSLNFSSLNIPFSECLAIFWRRLPNYLICTVTRLLTRGCIFLLLRNSAIYWSCTTWWPYLRFWTVCKVFDYFFKNESKIDFSSRINLMWILTCWWTCAALARHDGRIEYYGLNWTCA